MAAAVAGDDDQQADQAVTRPAQQAFGPGLALDFCVRYSAEDAIAEGFEAVVIPQASRAIDLDGSAAAAMASFAALGVALAAP